MNSLPISLKQVLSAATLLAVSAAAQANFSNAQIDVSLFFGNSSATQANTLYGVTGIAVTPMAELELRQSPGSLGILDNSVLTIDWTATATGGYVDFTLEASNSDVKEIWFQFRDSTGGVFNNVQRVWDGFGVNQSPVDVGFVLQPHVLPSLMFLAIDNLNNYTETGSGSYAATARYSFDFAPAAPVPEPATYASMALGLGLMGAVLRRRQRKAAV
jgi:hypothetical protein